MAVIPTVAALAAILVLLGLCLRRLSLSLFTYWQRLKLQLRLPPMPLRSSLILGHLSFMRDRHFMNSDEFVLKLTSKCPRLCRWRFGPTVIQLLVYHPQSVKPILRSSTPKNPFTYDFLRPMIGDGLLLSSGAKWFRDRRLLTPAFHFDVLKPYVDNYVRAANVFLDILGRQSEKESCVAVNISPLATLLALDVVLCCAMSFESDCQLGQSRYAEAVVALGQLTSERIYDLFTWPDVIYYRTKKGRDYKRLCEVCHDFCTMVIEERKRQLANGERHERDGERGRRHLDFLDILLTAKDSDGHGLNEQDMLNQVGTFMFGGHDTTATALQWTLYFFAKQQELQERCRQEVFEVVGNEQLTHDHLQELPLLTRFIKESIRLRSPVPYTHRTLTKPMVIDGYELPEGQDIVISPTICHRNPDVWANPLEFDPDRFLPERIDKQDPFSFIPFSAGPRNCIGQAMAMDELRSILAMCLMRFHFDVDPNGREPVMRDALVLKSENGIHLKVSALD